MRIIGIDPGLSGGIAILDDLKIYDIFDMPIMSEGKKNKNQLNSAQLVNILNKHVLKKENNVEIVDELNFKGPNSLIMFFVAPVLIFPIFLRKVLYRTYSWN